VSEEVFVQVLVLRSVVVSVVVVVVVVVVVGHLFLLVNRELVM
jgi:hypothetical protein